MKRLFSIILLCSTIMASHAIIVQHLYLKNGSVLKGFISSQIPGKSLTFTSDESIILMPDSLYKGSSSQTYKVSDLSQRWKDWAEANNAFNGVGEERELVLFNIETKSTNYHNVRLLKSGTEYQFVDLSTRKFDLKWSDIDCIKVPERSSMDLSGVDREYTLSDGRIISGQYVEEKVGGSIAVKTADGVISFASSEVEKCSFKKINPNQNLYEQSQLIDDLHLNGGQRVIGITIERSFKGKVDDYRYSIQREDGVIETVKYTDVTSINSDENPQYKPLTDIKVGKGEYFVNRIKVRSYKTNLGDPNYIWIDNIGTDTLSCMNVGKITLEYGNEHVFVGEPSLVRLTVDTKRVKKVEKKDYYVSYRDLHNREITSSESLITSVNGTRKVVFNVNAPGVYAVISKNENEVLLFEVK